MSTPLALAFGTGALLGKSIASDRPIRLKDPKRSTYLIGAHGTGKSTVMLNLILADIEKDDKGVVVLDPHGDLARAVAQRCPPAHAERVIYFAPSEQRDRVMGLNPFELRAVSYTHLDVYKRQGSWRDRPASKWHERVSPPDAGSIRPGCTFPVHRGKHRSRSHRG